MQDIRTAFRHLWRDKAFTLTSAVTLAVCIAANVAVFTVVDHVLLRPLRIPDSSRVLIIYNSYPNAGAARASATAPDYFDRLQYMTVFREQAMFTVRNPSLDLGGTPERIRAMHVTPSFFRLVQVLPLAGRGFTEDEGELGKERVTVLSEPLAARLFGAAPAVGSDVRIDGVPHVVVGVMPARFVFIDSDVEAWIPLAFTDQQKAQRFSNDFGYLGRLNPGATIQKAQLEVDALNQANLERHPETREVAVRMGHHAIVATLQDDLVREIRPTLSLLWGGAVFVLLIGAVNVASLVLVRSRIRLKDIATRMALGAGRSRTARQLIVEHVALTTMAAGAGLALGFLALELFGAANLRALPRGAEIALDARIVGMTAAAAIAIGGMLGFIPVVSVLPVALSQILRDEGRGGTSGRGVRTLRRVFVVTQIAVAFVLLIGAGLLFASFRRLLTVDPGFTASGVFTATVTLPESRYPQPADLVRFTDNALRAVRAVPGVTSAGTTSAIPFGDGFSQSVIFPEGYSLGPGESILGPYRSNVSPGYFESMRIKLLSGRLFDDRDSQDAPKTVIVDERLSRRYWRGVDPVGRRMYEPSDAQDVTAVTDRTQWFTVVGVVGEVKLRGAVEGVGEVGSYYHPQAQRPRRALTFVVLSSAPPETLAPAVRHAVATIDPELPLFSVETMDQRVDRKLAVQRVPMVLSMVFAAVAVFLSAVGIYGVLAYIVTQRTREIGIRLALGSTTRAVMRVVLGEGLAVVGIGLVAGAAGAAILRKSLESQLYGISATNPFVLVASVAVLAGVAIVACLLPARRATLVQPMVALRDS